MSKTGYINSFQSMGTLDGPGVRFVAFLQGCPLRCGCCHNPETWEVGIGDVYSSDEVIEKVIRFKEYFGASGGITLSGGEPLLQPEFCAEIFQKCHQHGIKTCLDTSGFAFNDEIKKVIDLTDYVMLDIKYTTDEDYQKYVGCSLSKPLEFLEYLNENGKAVRIRQVIIPSLNDDDENIRRLADIVNRYPCVEMVELLPFKKMCKHKYESKNIKFAFENYTEPTKQDIQNLYEKLNSFKK